MSADRWDALVDGTERVLRTAVQAAAGTWLIEQQVNVTGLKVAGVAALVSVVMCVAGSRVGDPSNTSLLSSAD
jgi:hypothetical protein